MIPARTSTSVAEDSVKRLARFLAVSRSLASGADFRLVGPDDMMLEATVPIGAVDVIWTGCGKSPTARKLTDFLVQWKMTVVVVREQMLYGDLVEQCVQRFETLDDLEASNVTINEREEYEGHIEREYVVYAGVDYEAILKGTVGSYRHRLGWRK